LKSDGTVVAWGNNNFGQSSVPPGLTGVVEIAAGGDADYGIAHSLALKSDGTITAWGSNQSGQITVPTEVRGVSRIAAGSRCSIALAPSPGIAFSQKIHRGTDSFAIELPLNGIPGIECRTADTTNDEQLIVRYASDVQVSGTPQAAITLGTGTIGTGGVSNGGAVSISGSEVTIPLTNVSNAQTINVTLFGVNGGGNVVIPMRVLSGDVNADGRVNASDIALTKSRSGQLIDQTNFRADVNANGSINATDACIVKSQSGTGLP